jgi:hypothetical protein
MATTVTGTDRSSDDLGRAQPGEDTVSPPHGDDRLDAGDEIYKPSVTSVA